MIVLLTPIALFVGYLVIRIELRRSRVRHLPRAASDHVTNRTCTPLLCLFTTFRPGDYKIPVSIYYQVVTGVNPAGDAEDTFPQ